MCNTRKCSHIPSTTNPHKCFLILHMCANMPHTQTHMHTHCTHTQFWLLWPKSTYGPLIWSLKVFGHIFNSAGEQVCQLLDCLNHIIPPLCILMNVHQATRCVCLFVCVWRGCEHFVCTRGVQVHAWYPECTRSPSSVCEYLDTHQRVPWHALNLHYVQLRGTKTICNFTRRCSH